MYQYTGRPGQIPAGGPRIAVIGGGTGLSVILRGLKKVTSNVSAIVTVTDDGGGSGVIRSEMGILPPGDIRNCILALADDEDIMEKLLQYRFREGRLSGQNMGNLFLAALTDIYGNFEKAVYKLQDILRIKGKVIPVTLENADLCAELEDGTQVVGESRIPEEVVSHHSPIEHVYLDPPWPRALDAAVKAIRSADMIVLGPGSLYTSIIPNLLVKGIADAIRDAAGMKTLICNIMTQPGETDDFTVTEYAETVVEYLGSNVLDYMLINDQRLENPVIRPYLKHGIIQLIADDKDRKALERMHITPIESNMVYADEGVVRHDADRVGNIIIALVHEG